MHFHAQNLNDKSGGRTGSILRYGRCWWHFNERSTIRLEWNFNLNGPAVGLELGHFDDAISFHVSAIIFSLWLTLEQFTLSRWISNKIKRPDQKYGNGRTIGFKWYEDRLWIDLWDDPMEHRSVDPSWWHITIVPVDILLGPTKCSNREIARHRVEIPMPEACYPATVVIQEWEWKRSRWPFPKRLIRSEITPDTPVPFPGKGENSWDCGEDATSSMTCCADTPLKAVVAMVKSVLEDRYRHGGKMWRSAAVSK